MLSKGIVIPLSFASLPVISITFFDKKKRSRRSEREDEVDVPPDGLSVEDLEKLDLDQLECQSCKLSDGDSHYGPDVLVVLPGWYFIPSITIALPPKRKNAEPLFDSAEDAEIIEGIRKAPLPDTLFTSAKEYDRPASDRDVAEFDPVTDAIIRPDADTESIVVPKAMLPPVQGAGLSLPEKHGSGLPLDLSDIDLDLDEESAVPMAPVDVMLPDDHLIIPETPAPEPASVLPVNMDRDDLDLMLGGGLPRASIILIEGRKGSGVENLLHA